MEEINDLLEQLHTLLDDYEELLEMDKNTSDVEREITFRVQNLKLKTREQIENSLDIPVILDGELLTFEKAVKRRKYIDGDVDPNIFDKINVKNDGYQDYYYYLEKEIYHLDVEEEHLMKAIRFVNSKKDLQLDSLRNVLDAIAHVCVISYGFRLHLEGIIEKKLNVENIYTGTIFNNSRYSSRTYMLLDKLFLKLALDYIERTKSSYDVSDYIIHKVEKHWLIINKKNGATDVLGDELSEICEAANNVTKCFDNENILENNKNTDIEIGKLHQIIEKYIMK